MREDHHTALVRRLFDEVFNKLDWAVANEIVAPSYVGHDPPDSPATIRGPEAMTWSASNMHTAFPDGEFVVQDIVANGKKAAVRVVFHGTHLGDLATPKDPIRATGRRVTIAGLVMYRFANDQIVETWGCWEVLGLRAQLGARAFRAPARFFTRSLDASTLGPTMRIRPARL